MGLQIVENCSKLVVEVDMEVFIKQVGKYKRKYTRFTCADCNEQQEVRLDSILQRKDNASEIRCNICTSRLNGKLNKKHGMYKSPTYMSWKKMKDRCLNPNHMHYHTYGGRGINICDKWMSFEGFFEDMGEMPEKGYSVDRINSDGNYTKENCRWIPRNHQQKNRRKSSEWIYTKTNRCGKTYKGKQK